MKYLISISGFITKQFQHRAGLREVFDIDNAISPSFFKETRISDHRFALYVGSLDDRKSVMDLVWAVEKTDQVTLKIISGTSSGEYLENMKRYIRENDLGSRIEFLGARNNEEVMEIMKNCTSVVLPSRKEGAPMIISEAMAVGKPVIASLVDGIPYMITNETTGFFFCR